MCFVALMALTSCHVEDKGRPGSLRLVAWVADSTGTYRPKMEYDDSAIYQKDTLFYDKVARVSRWKIAIVKMCDSEMQAPLAGPAVTNPASNK